MFSSSTVVEVVVVISDLVQPQLFASIGLQFLPEFVGLGDNFLRFGGVLVLLVESERVDGLVIGGLVPPEPFSDTVLDGIRNVVDVVVFLGERIVDGNCQELPVQFTIVDHGQDSEDLDFRDGSHLLAGSNLDDIDRIVVAEDSEFGVLDVGVFPCLGKASCVIVIVIVIVRVIVVCSRNYSRVVT